jgi:hypothetical protein
MKIELLYFEGCPGWRDAEGLIEAVMQSQGVAAEVELTNVKTQAEAGRLRFLGSPTIRVNGVDIDPVARSSTEYGLKCRVYRAGERFVGVPPRELLEHAIQEARNGQDCCAPHS